MCTTIELSYHPPLEDLLSINNAHFFQDCELNHGGKYYLPFIITSIRSMEWTKDSKLVQDCPIAIIECLLWASSLIVFVRCLSWRTVSNFWAMLRWITVLSLDLLLFLLNWFGNSVSMCHDRVFSAIRKQFFWHMTVVHLWN